jgi:hypothetical protein
LTDKENAMNSLIRIVALALLLSVPTASLSAQNQNAPVIKPNSNPQSEPPHATRAFLGVSVGPTFPGPGTFQPGNANPQQGLVVQRVAPNSPAEKAGIKVGDNLMAFGDQRLVAADQLARLVRGDQPHHQVMIELLREGKPQKLQVTLGEAPAGLSRDFMPPMGPMGRPFGPGMGPTRGWNSGQELNSVWQKFDSLSLKKTGDNKFRVDMEYLEKDTKTNTTQPKKYEFEGTPDEIHRAIEQAKDLTPPQRFQLHRMLQFPGLERGFPFPNMRPGMGAWSPPSPHVDDTPSQ